MELTLGKRIGQYRRQRNMTQEELAQKLGVTAQAVSKWENDASCPDIALLPQLANLLGIRVDTLLTGEAEPEIRVLPPELRKDPKEMFLRILIDSADGDRVRVNLPLALVELMQDSKHPMGLPDALKNVDLRQLLEMVRQGAVGNLVEIESADGDTVRIYVE